MSKKKKKGLTGRVRDEPAKAMGVSPTPQEPGGTLPDIQDNVRDSGGVFVFGMASSGERVDEKSAMQIATVYACVRLLAESVAGLPLHLYRSEGEDGKMKAKDHPLYKILYRQANPEMSSFSFWEAMMTHLLLWGNAYAQIVRDGKNGILGLYPLLPDPFTRSTTHIPMKCPGRPIRIFISTGRRSSISRGSGSTGW